MRYEFRQADAERFARERGIRTIVRRGELHFRECPYCKNQTDDRNTFAINLSTGMFKCLRATCGAKGNMITLARDFDFSLGKEFDEFYGNTKQYRNLRQYTTPETSEPAIKFLESRGISAKTGKLYNITTKEGQDNIICFPFYDENDVLQFVKYRKADFDKDRDNNKEWCLSGCKPILFGMNHCQPYKDKALVLTEGQLDSLSVAEALGNACNVVSVPNGAKGFSWVPHCWSFLQEYKALIVFGDYEGGKITLLEEMASRFHGIVKHVRPEDYRGCKDANELLLEYGKEAVRSAVYNAIPVKNEKILDVSEVARRSVVEDSIDSGINQLNAITGGFPLGRVVVITGQSGRGKSTLATQFAIRAAEQGYKAFVYSGELADWEVARAVDRQVAGPDYLESIKTKLGFLEYSVKDAVREYVQEWGNNRLFLYNNSIIGDDEEEHDALIRTIKDAVKQYGCKVIVLDNLMTAMMDDVNLDLYRQQTRFVLEVHNLANALGVLIILVAHQRKRMTGGFQNDDIAGSSNITNLVDIVLNYAEPEAEKGEVVNASYDGDRVLQVTKNRITGQLETEGIKLWFEKASTRISEDRTYFSWGMDWKAGTEDFKRVTEGDMDEIPF